MPAMDAAKSSRDYAALASGTVIQNRRAQEAEFSCGSPIMISTDPPYYDNIGYADLSDFFYVWLRRTLQQYSSRLVSRVLLLQRPKSLSRLHIDMAVR